jgi:hypothetical protein
LQGAEADFDVDPTGSWAGFPEAAANIEDLTESDLKPEGFIGGLKLGWNTMTKMVGLFLEPLSAPFTTRPSFPG